MPDRLFLITGGMFRGFARNAGSLPSIHARWMGTIEMATTRTTIHQISSLSALAATDWFIYQFHHEGDDSLRSRIGLKPT
jgi:hypothetical protein